MNSSILIPEKPYFPLFKCCAASYGTMFHFFIDSYEIVATRFYGLRYILSTTIAKVQFYQRKTLTVPQKDRKPMIVRKKKLMVLSNR